MSTGNPCSVEFVTYLFSDVVMSVCGHFFYLFLSRFIRQKKTDVLENLFVYLRVMICQIAFIYSFITLKHLDSFLCIVFIRAIFKLYICFPTNCTQLIYFINNPLKHMYCLKL